MILLHELAHAMAARKLGRNVKAIVLGYLGGFTEIDMGPDFGHRLLIFAAGPLSNGLAALVVWSAWLLGEPYLHGDLRQFCYSLLWLNAILAIGNLFPVWPLDGARLIEAALQKHCGILVTRTTVGVIGFIIVSPLMLYWLAQRNYLAATFALVLLVLNAALVYWSWAWQLAVRSTGQYENASCPICFVPALNGPNIACPDCGAFNNQFIGPCWQCSNPLGDMVSCPAYFEASPRSAWLASK